MRVVLEDGEQLGILSRDEALRTAQEKGLDLVEITARATPPVCRIMDYGRFKYEQSKKAKEAKKHASTVELKEIKFRPKTDEHDLAFKIKHVTRFLEEGNKCRLVVIFRGREVVHPKTGLAVLDRVLAATSELSQVEVRPNLEGKRMIMIIGPKPGIKRKTKGGHEAQQTSKRGKGKNKSKGAPEVESSDKAQEDSDKALEEMNAAAEAEAADDNSESSEDETSESSEDEKSESSEDEKSESSEESSAKSADSSEESPKVPTPAAPDSAAPAASADS